MQPETYSIKEMIEEIREHINKRFDIVDGRFDTVDKRLDKVVERQDYANGKLGRHGWYFTALWWGLGVLGTALVIGVPKLYNMVVEDASARGLSKLEEKYNPVIKYDEN